MNSRLTFGPEAEAGLAPYICTGRVEETADAATFAFRTADSMPLAYKAGQFMIFQVEVGGEALHRAYSLCTSPSRPGNFAITVKRVPGGKVSNHLLDKLKPGHMLRALPPAGEFNPVDCASTDKVVFLSAGCGITPCISMARWLLDTRPQAEIRFIHSARRGSEVILAGELARLQAEHPNFSLARVLNEPESQADFQGRLDQALFDQLLPDLAGRTLFACGPEAYMAAAASFARQRGFDMARFHQESFAPPAAGNGAEAAATRYTLQVPRFGKSTDIGGGQTLLEALEGAKVPIIGACRSGICGACKCRVAAGEVESSTRGVLTEGDAAAGYVLACSTRPKSDLVVEV